MICCLSPNCAQPQNSDGSHYCQQCGSPLPSLLRNRYKITQLLGKGGFGRTYLAQDTDKLNERCVVKQLTYQSSDAWMKQKAIQLFEGEAQQLQQLGAHPQIPALLGYFEEGGCLYLVQQFIEGKNLKQFLDYQGPLPGEQIRQILLSLLPVLQYIHERGVVHRDIKPDNIMHLPGSRKYILIDFGVAKPIPDRAIEHSGTVIGSPGYAALEQMHEGIATPSGDLFGLGVSCFHLMSQVSPSILSREQGYSWLDSWQDYVSQSLSPSLQQVLSRLLQKDASCRYQSAEAALQDLTPPLPPYSQQAHIPEAPLLTASPPPPPVRPQSPVEASRSAKTTLVDSSLNRPTRFVFHIAPKESPTALANEVRTPTKPKLNLGVSLLLLTLGSGIGYLLTLVLPATLPKPQPQLPAPSQQVQSYLHQGDEKFAQGEYQQALRKYAAALQLDPKNDKAHFSSGITQHRLNNHQEALTHYTTAIRLNPQFADAYNNRGLVNSHLGDKPEAIADFTEAIRIDPQHLQAFNNRGTTYADLDDPDAAIADYTQVLQINAQYFKAYFNRGNVHSKLGNLDAAIADYTQVIHINPQYTQAYNNRGIAHFDLGNLDAAIADYTQTLRINPQYAQAYNNRGTAQSALGNQQAALADYTQAIQINPQYAQAYNNRGTVNNQLGDKQAAIHDLQTAAELYRQQGQLTQSQKIVDKIQKLL